MEYKVITVREFKARFSHYIGLMKEGYNFEVNGLLIGDLRSHGVINVVTEKEMALEGEQSVVTPVVTEDKRGEMCDMCSHFFTENVYKTYEDGGDFLICLDCVTNKCSSEKHLRATLKTLDKIL